MRKRVATALTLLLAAGCIDLEEEYTLNPDGSGKVAVRWVSAPPGLGGEKGADATAIALLKDEILNAEGVDAWKDASCTVRDDGKFEFKGTAYFTDFSKLKLHNMGQAGIAFKSSRDAAGNLVIVKEQKERRAVGGGPLSDEDARKKLREVRAEYQKGKQMLESMLTEFRNTVRINLPGRIGSRTNFEKTSDTSIRIMLEGRTLLKAHYELIMNDEWMLKQLKEHGDVTNAAIDERLVEKVFGEKGPIRAVTTGGLKPQFDYAAEAAQAHKEQEELGRKLGGNTVGPPAEPEPPQKPKNLH